MTAGWGGRKEGQRGGTVHVISHQHRKKKKEAKGTPKGKYEKTQKTLTVKLRKKEGIVHGGGAKAGEYEQKGRGSGKKPDGRRVKAITAERVDGEESDRSTGGKGGGGPLIRDRMRDGL